MTDSSGKATDRSGFQTLQISKVREEAGDSIVVSFDVSPELEGAYSFMPGQHLTLRRDFDGEEVRRSYSICAAPNEKRLEIAIRRLDSGLFSNWAAENLRPGYLVDVMRPSGHFTVPGGNSAGRDVVFIAAGCGITPILSQMRAVLEAEPATFVTLLYLNRTSETTMFVEELLALKNRYLERCTICFQSSKEEADGALFNGRLTPTILRELLTNKTLPHGASAWMLCGPQSMIEMVRSALSSAGIDDSRVHSELFGVTAAPVAAPQANVGDARALMRFNGRNTNVTVPAGMNMLDAGRRLRGDLPFACKTGVCSTCRARVLKGRVEMVANFALEPDEVQRGFVLTCQAYPTTDEVEIDFDA